jgi:hypothetical protein
VFARASLFQPPQSVPRAPDGDLHIALKENRTSWTYTRNIVYDTFEDWQKTGQDNGSIIADPLFAGDVNQCDFFLNGY